MREEKRKGGTRRREDRQGDRQAGKQGDKRETGSQGCRQADRETWYNQRRVHAGSDAGGRTAG